MSVIDAAAMSPGAGGLDVLSAFEVAPPALVQARALQHRVDRKHLLAAGDVGPLLHRLRSGYMRLHTGPDMWTRYENTYFDSPERELYHAHRRGRRPRHKVRIRHHVDRQLSFLEIKRKENSGRTMKLRLPLPYGQNELGSRERQFIEAHAPLEAARLVPSVSISFLRLTLVGGAVNERLTLDHELVFSAGPRTERVLRLVIAEVKQSRHADHQGAIPALRAQHAREEALSKYCLGTILLTPVRANVFKPALRAVERLSV